MAVNDFAELTGMYQNRSFYARNFPAIWRLTTFVKIVIVRFGLGLMFFLGRPIWSEMTFLMEDPETYKKGDDVSIVTLMVYSDADGELIPEDRFVSSGASFRWNKATPLDCRSWYHLPRADQRDVCIGTPSVSIR